MILEALLDYLVLKYECPVPRKRDNRFTLGELLQALSKKLKETLEVVEVSDGVEGNRTKLGPTLGALQEVFNVRNVAGAHFNELAQHLPEDDGLRFARDVQALFELVVHPEHGWPDNDKSGSYWRNVGDTRRLYPLKRPG